MANIIHNLFCWGLQANNQHLSIWKYWQSPTRKHSMHSTPNEAVYIFIYFYKKLVKWQQTHLFHSTTLSMHTSTESFFQCSISALSLSLSLPHTHTHTHTHTHYTQKELKQTNHRNNDIYTKVLLWHIFLDSNNLPYICKVHSNTMTDLYTWIHRNMIKKISTISAWQHHYLQVWPHHNQLWFSTSLYRSILSPLVYNNQCGFHTDLPKPACTTTKQRTVDENHPAHSTSSHPRVYHNQRNSNSMQINFPRHSSQTPDAWMNENVHASFYVLTKEPVSHLIVRKMQ